MSLRRRAKDRYRYAFGDTSSAREPAEAGYAVPVLRKELPVPDLTGKQKRYLRGLGHHLEPVIHLGKGGVNENVIRQADEALEAHELIKVRFGDGFGQTANDGARDLAGPTGSAVAGRVGRTALLYRRRKEKPEIELPPADGSA